MIPPSKVMAPIATINVLTVYNANFSIFIQADIIFFSLLIVGSAYDFVYLDIWDTFPGYEKDLEMLEEIIELYIPICPSCRVNAWGYEFAEAGLDDSPIEVGAYDDYLKALKAADM